MDSTKNNKKEKLGADGLSKKERRALKVQAREPSDIKSNLKSATEEVPNSKVMPSNNNINKSAIARTVSEKSSGIKLEEASACKQLSDKELRKLEWQKKHAELNTDTMKQNKEPLSKAELKAKRREQQEAQRLAKIAAPVVKPTVVASKAGAFNVVTKTPTQEAISEINRKKVNALRQSPRRMYTNRVHKVKLVEHLFNMNSREYNSPIIVYNDIHPAFVRLGVQYSNKTILGSNARCLALLATLKCLVNDLQTPPKQEFCRYLETVLKKCTTYLEDCRQPAVSMTNALTYFKLQLTHVNTNLDDDKKKKVLRDIIDTYIFDDIKKAHEQISIKVGEKVTNGDVILTYGCSSLVRTILLDAHKGGKKFKVIIADGRPLLEGREMLRRLVIAGIECEYILINSVSFLMSSVTKVILGAHALLTNGYVMSRIGTAQVALVAQAYNKPVLVCCESYKFSERVQTDSFVYNEIDDPNKWKKDHSNKPSDPLSNLLYDVTPPDFVTAVVTEKAIIPCTSVPVVLRINANEGL